jgi:hypothetical protein
VHHRRRKWIGLGRGATAIVVALAVACTHHPTQAPVDPATLPPLPRSSLAAVILHRSELGLTDDQVRELEQIDQRREAEDAAARADLAPKAKSATASPNSGSGTGNAATTTPSGAPAGGPSGSGMGGGRMGGMRGGRMGGRGFRAPDNNGARSGQRAAKLEDRLEDDDTKAYLDGEEVLTEPQREQAREIASDYRAQIYDRRELLKQKANGK